MSKIKKIVLSAMFLALIIIFSRFLSFKSDFLSISFSFIPIILSAIYLGPKYAALIAGLGDFIGAMLFPFGSYFPGFTFNAIITGFIYGLFLYETEKNPFTNKKFFIRLVISNVIVVGGIGIFLTGLWLTMLYGKAYVAILLTRVIPQLILIPIQVSIIFATRNSLKSAVDKYL